MFMLGTITSEHFDFTVISFNWNLESENVVASHDVLEHILINVSFLSGFVNEHLNLLQESWLVLPCLFGHSWLEVDWCISVDPSHVFDRSGFGSKLSKSHFRLENVLLLRNDGSHNVGSLF